ncbi:MAG: DarT ssDNA thymidine ADP-ribosyltransferase family protein [Inhella sp.]
MISTRKRRTGASLQWLFTDSHAYYQWANFYGNLVNLNKIDWPILQARDFKRDPDDPAKFERYQAEALVHLHMPVSALLGVVCYTPALRQNIEQHAAARQLKLAVHARPGWYF